ncbi:GNAT family N-acetyltransferase [Pseudoroseicyclus sp. CXY001]|uniref:GNAT family N-acetyltransferase n=1 Tax=Pseudoroseicyclus sp. CXY001 TaxID=3242492 RepID=UPI0035709C37
MIPELVTERLRLRAPVIEDFAPYAAFCASPRAAHMGGPHDAETAWNWFASDVAQWPLLGHGALMVERSEDGTLLGQVGIARPPHFPEPQIGWFAFKSTGEGGGYFAEAAAALLSWAFGPRGMATLVSYIRADNLRSARLARRLGAVIDRAAPLPPGLHSDVWRFTRDAGAPA